jgi:1-aminocyclopropane-1-carboxylate deaminase
LNFSSIDIQPITAEWLTQKEITLDVLRLDKIHPVVSGNKYFKLKYYFEDALAGNKKTIATFGGAWSNHIVATAYSSQEAGLNSIGFVRGEQPASLSESLRTAISYGMNIKYISRLDYRNKEEIIHNYSNENWYWINEGGYGIPGAIGASEIMKIKETGKYHHIIAAVGTGTMLAGLVLGAAPHQQILGISSMKGNDGLVNEIEALTKNLKLSANFKLIQDYHFGGYGKHPEALINYINKVYQNHLLPLDIVYTGKTFYAIEELAKKDFFPRETRLLMIHSGGLQGNNSLPAKVLAF